MNTFVAEVEANLDRRQKFYAIALPPLQGTHKQVVWANQIRQEAVTVAWRAGVSPMDWVAIAHRFTDASWWIDNRNQGCDRTQLLDAIKGSI